MWPLGSQWTEDSLRRVGQIVKEVGLVRKCLSPPDLQLYQIGGMDREGREREMNLTKGNSSRACNAIPVKVVYCVQDVLLSNKPLYFWSVPPCIFGGKKPDDPPGWIGCEDSCSRLSIASLDIKDELGGW